MECWDNLTEMFKKIENLLEKFKENVNLGI